MAIFRPQAGRSEQPWAAHRGGAAEALRRGCFCTRSAPTPLCGVGLASSERPLEPTRLAGARAATQLQARCVAMSDSIGMVQYTTFMKCCPFCTPTFDPSSFVGPKGAEWDAFKRVA